MNKTQFVLSHAESMMPLVRMILTDLTQAHRDTLCLRKRLQLLEPNRTSDNYEVRRQYWECDQQLTLLKRSMEEFRLELKKLGVTLIDIHRGCVGFPFSWKKNRRTRRVRNAIFLFRLSDDPALGIRHWRFVNERHERRVAPHWLGQLSLPVFADVSLAEQS